MYSLPSFSSSLSTTMATSTSPTLIKKPLVEWDKKDVATFLDANKHNYLIEEDLAARFVGLKYNGRGLLMLRRDELVGDGMPPGDATTIMSLITDLKIAKGVHDPGKLNLDSFSNFAYLLTGLSLL